MDDANAKTDAPPECHPPWKNEPQENEEAQVTSQDQSKIHPPHRGPAGGHRKISKRQQHTLSTLLRSP
jgi:hypothetical protein